MEKQLKIELEIPQKQLDKFLESLKEYKDIIHKTKNGMKIRFYRRKQTNCHSEVTAIKQKAFSDRKRGEAIPGGG